MTAPVVIVPAADLALLIAKVDALAARLEGATVIPAPEWSSIPDAARRLGVSPATIRRRINAGQIEARGNGKLRQVRV